MNAFQVDEVLSLAAEMDALGQAIAASLDDPPTLLNYVRKRERCLCRASSLLGNSLPPGAMLTLASRFAAIDAQTLTLCREVDERRDGLARRLAGARLGQRLETAYAR